MTQQAAVYQFFRGDTWKMPVIFTAGGQPFNLAGATFGADLYIRGAAQPFATLSLADGSATVTDLQGGSVDFILDDIRSAGIPADPLSSISTVSYPTRLVPWVIDSLGNRTTAAIDTINVLDSRFANQSNIVVNPTTPASLANPQGPAGPAVSVNGHSGAIQTLTAADVGAYSKGEVDALLQAAIATAVAEAVAAVNAPLGALDLSQAGNFSPLFN